MRQTTERMVLIGAALVAATLGGCALRANDAAAPPGAAAFFAPVGPLELMRHRPPEQRTRRPPSTATVHSGPPAAKVPDSKLRLDVGMKLQSSKFGLADIAIEVDDQRVRLSGTAPSLKARDRAELLARSVTGVAGVHNAIDVERGDSQ